VVVYDVEQHGQPAGVARVDEALELVRRAIGVVGREQVHAVVPPAPAPGKLGDGHQLDMGHAELDEVIEVGDGGDEGAGVAEGAHVHFVDHGM
jgi:hypothetical protein